MIVSARSHLSAGLAAGLVLAATGAAVVAPTAGPPPIRVASPAVALTAAFPQLPVIDFSGVADSSGDWIINAYGVIQPWVAYGVELFAWATEWLPWPIGLLAPQSDIIYNAWQPFAESVVYSLAFLVDGEFDLILPTLSVGIQTGITNLVQGEIDWILSFFPPLPPIGFAAAAATTRTVGQLALPAPAAAITETVTETVSTQTITSESEQTAAESETPAAESEPVAAPVAAAEEQPATVEVAEPETAPQPRPATRGAARMAQSVPAASATEVSAVTTAAPEAAAEPASAPKARKAFRGAEPSGSTARAGRAERAAR